MNREALHKHLRDAAMHLHNAHNEGCMSPAEEKLWDALMSALDAISELAKFTELTQP